MRNCVELYHGCVPANKKEIVCVLNCSFTLISCTPLLQQLLQLQLELHEQLRELQLRQLLLLHDMHIQKA